MKKKIVHKFYKINKYIIYTNKEINFAQMIIIKILKEFYYKYLNSKIKLVLQSYSFIIVHKILK